MISLQVVGGWCRSRRRARTRRCLQKPDLSWLGGSSSSSTGASVDTLSVTGYVPRALNLLTFLRPIPLRVLRAILPVLALALERVDVAERTGVRKVELDDIVPVIEWGAGVRP